MDVRKGNKVGGRNWDERKKVKKEGRRKISNGEKTGGRIWNYWMIE